MPTCLYTCRTLEVLKLHGKLNLNVSDYGCLPKLTSLEVVVDYVYSSDLYRLITGCSSLESLVIGRDVYNDIDETLVIDSSTLKYFKYGFLSSNEEACRYIKFVLNAPALEYFHFNGNIFSDFSIENICSLDYASVCICLGLEEYDNDEEEDAFNENDDNNGGEEDAFNENDDNNGGEEDVIVDNDYNGEHVDAIDDNDNSDVSGEKEEDALNGNDDNCEDVIDDSDDSNHSDDLNDEEDVIDDSDDSNHSNDLNDRDDSGDSDDNDNSNHISDGDDSDDSDESDENDDSDKSDDSDEEEDILDGHYKRVMKLLLQIQDVKHLWLASDTLEALSNVPAPESRSEYKRCSKLIMDKNVCDYNSLQDLLKGSGKSHDLHLSKDYSDFTHMVHWKNPEELPICLLSCLETISVCGFRGRKGELSMIAYILENAKVLRSLIISEANSNAKVKFELRKKILKFDQGSYCCKITFSCDDPEGLRIDDILSI